MDDRAATKPSMWPEILSASGWALDLVAAIDQRHPQHGLAGRYLRSTNARRQVVAACLSVMACPLDEPAGEDDVRALAIGRSRDLLARAFGVVPEGFRGALSRTEDIQERGYYRTLHRVLSSPRHSGAAKVVRQVSTLTESRLHGILRLPDELRRPGVIEQIPDLSTARDLAVAFDLIARNAAATSTDLLASLKAASRSGSIAVWAGNWMDRLEFPENPIPTSGNYRPVRTGRELRKIALKYRNCARSLLVGLVEGHSALAELDCIFGSVLVHLRQDVDGFMLDSINRRANSPVEPELHAEAVMFLKAHGVRTVEMPRRNYRFAALQRIARLTDDWRWL